MFRNRSRRFWTVLVVVVALAVFYLPPLVAYRYTASTQNTSFLIHPWRGWAFAWTALTVPGSSKLKTSGQALRASETLFGGSGVDPQQVRLLFLDEGDPYTFTHDVAGKPVTTTVTPAYRFVWQVSGVIDTRPPSATTIVAMLDYRTGAVLYDVRTDVPAGVTLVEPSASPSPSSSAP